MKLSRKPQAINQGQHQPQAALGSEEAMQDSLAELRCLVVTIHSGAFEVLRDAGGNCCGTLTRVQSQGFTAEPGSVKARLCEAEWLASGVPSPLQPCLHTCQHLSGEDGAGRAACRALGRPSLPAEVARCSSRVSGQRCITHCIPLPKRQCRMCPSLGLGVVGPWGGLLCEAVGLSTHPTEGHTAPAGSEEVKSF